MSHFGCTLSITMIDYHPLRISRLRLTRSYEDVRLAIRQLPDDRPLPKKSLSFHRRAVAAARSESELVDLGITGSGDNPTFPGLFSGHLSARATINVEFITQQNKIASI
jgi:hypothetical protein